MAKKIEIVNPTALTDYLDRLETVASEEVLRQAAVAGARVIHSEVRLRAPVGTPYERKGSQHVPGTLKRSILIAYDKEESIAGHLAIYLVTWSKDAFYGRFVEFGTSHSAAKPFLRPAFEATKRAAADAVIEVIQKKAEEAARGE
ncbi:HK97-gp10 family putative phage morphogenesis protein [Caballeronia sp. LZ035]|uniref:HK97-gp10 family putative phage morphogenesis protein n=1 Tax=Caballeronia sp. LZ035 TaxID=3038568 RepID=UPI0028649AD2|nr:HK97-gp10 family putative phage morphogenesis protein [Caballeronia sp. LZ035]MDR5761958.1 HK97 gp10 family phage protein [Caballeronia sp. LZ035]